MKTMAIVFILQVKIGGVIYYDILTLNSLSEEQVIGTFEVPKVFKAPFKGILNQKTLKGSFIAKERGNEFKVTLESNLKGKCSIIGTLSQEEKVFAHFQGERSDCHE